MNKNNTLFAMLHVLHAASIQSTILLGFRSFLDKLPMQKTETINR